MIGHNYHSVLREEEGSGLLAVLVLITVMSLLVGAVLALYTAQYRFIRRDAHRLQARYAAEAGVYITLDSLQDNPLWRASDAPLRLPEGQESRVTVEAFGGCLIVRSEAQYRRSRATVRVLVGEIPPPSFENALQQWDGTSGLHVAGHTHITGTMVVGTRGMKTKTFKRRRFTGRIRGAVFNVPDLAPPYFDKQFLEAALEEAEHYLHAAPDASQRVSDDQPVAKRLPSENPVHVFVGDHTIIPGDSLLFKKPVTVVASGRLALEGLFHFEPGTMFIAGKGLSIKGKVSGRDGLFFGREGVEIADSARFSGQVFSRKYIRLSKGSYLAYPSVLYATGEAEMPEGNIILEDGTILDGTIIYPPMELEPSVRRGRVRVEPQARVRGAIFNAHETEFHGTLYGALLTRQLYFYESPTSYINWIKDAVIDSEARPIEYLLPLGFSASPRLEVLRWDVHLEDGVRRPSELPSS